MNIDPVEIRLLVLIATRRTGRPLHDEDLEQDATLKAVEAFRKQFEVRYPRAFLRKIVGDTVRDHWRRRRQTEELTSLDENIFAESPRFEERLDLERRIGLLRHGLAQLDPGKRITLDLFYVEEWSVSKIARVRKKSVSAVKMELLRARRTLAGIVRRLADKKSGLITPAANKATSGFRGMIPDHENRASTADNGATGRARTEDSPGYVREICSGSAGKGGPQSECGSVIQPDEGI
jgi:RNA polymerase sigma factor (sigma-70 family)